MCVHAKETISFMLTQTARFNIPTAYRHCKIFFRLQDLPYPLIPALQLLHPPMGTHYPHTPNAEIALSSAETQSTVGQW